MESKTTTNSNKAYGKFARSAAKLNLPFTRKYFPSCNETYTQKTRVKSRCYTHTFHLSILIFRSHHKRNFLQLLLGIAQNFPPSGNNVMNGEFASQTTLLSINNKK